MTIKQLMARRADSIAQAQALLDAEGGLAGDEQQAQFDALMASAEADLAQAQRLARIDRARQAQADMARTAPSRPALPEDDAGSDASGRLTAEDVDELAGSAERLTGGRPRLADDPTGGYATLGEFALAVHGVGTRGVDERLRILGAAGTGLNAGIGSEGGFLMPAQFSNTIWEGLMGDADSLLARCDVYNLPPQYDSISFPANAETSRADGYRWGGVRGYWISELAAMTEGMPKFREVKLEPKQLTVLAYASDKLLRSSQVVEQWLTRSAIDEINFKVGDAIVNGLGAGQPLGLLKSSSLISITKETGQAADTVVVENLVKMWARCMARARANAVWLINQTVEPQLLTMALAVGAGGSPVYLPPGGISAAPYGTILGRPVLNVEYCQAIGDAGDIVLAGLGAYAVAVRGGVQSAMSIHLKFDYNQTAFRFLFEVDGQPWLASAVTPFKGGSSNTLSTHVALAAR